MDFKRYDSKVANEYADLMSAIEDLNEAAAHFHHAATAVPESGTTTITPTLVRAHWIAGMTLYGRVFKTGVRSFDKSLLLVSMHQSMRELHDWVLLMRDKHICHSVNLHEDSIACVGRANGETEFGHHRFSFLYPDRKDLEQCERLATEVSAIAQAQATILRVAFDREVKRLTDSGIAAMPPVVFTAPGPTGAAVARPRKT